jgi:hypothetical protein
MAYDISVSGCQKVPSTSVLKAHFKIKIKIADIVVQINIQLVVPVYELVAEGGQEYEECDKSGKCAKGAVPLRVPVFAATFSEPGFAICKPVLTLNGSYLNKRSQ